MAARVAYPSIVARIGSELDSWDFYGQVYETETPRQCGITHQLTRHCYILRRKDQSIPGKITIGPQSFRYVARMSPDLLAKLKVGQEYLALHLLGIRSQSRHKAGAERMQKALAKWRGLVDKALRRVDSAKPPVGSGEASPQIMELAKLSVAQMPPFKREVNQAIWYESQCEKIQVLLDVTAPKKAPVKRKAAPVVVEAPVIEMPAAAPVANNNSLIDSVVFEDIFN